MLCAVCDGNIAPNCETEYNGQFYHWFCYVMAVRMEPAEKYGHDGELTAGDAREIIEAWERELEHSGQ